MKVALRVRKGHSMVIVEHLDRDHCERLALRGISLSRHDGGTRFVSGNCDIGNPGPPTAGVLS